MKQKIKNPVAKNLNTFNKPSVERDKTKYHRPSAKKSSMGDGFFVDNRSAA